MLFSRCQLNMWHIRNCSLWHCMCLFVNYIVEWEGVYFKIQNTVPTCQNQCFCKVRINDVKSFALFDLSWPVFHTYKQLSNAVPSWYKSVLIIVYDVVLDQMIHYGITDYRFHYFWDYWCYADRSVVLRKVFFYFRIDSCDYCFSPRFMCSFPQWFF